jgi:hypothetical protein
MYEVAKSLLPFFDIFLIVPQAQHRRSSLLNIAAT